MLLDGVLLLPPLMQFQNCFTALKATTNLSARALWTFWTQKQEKKCLTVKSEPLLVFQKQKYI